MQDKKIIFSHRGFHDNDVPENSLTAFRRSLKAGYGIELDVRLSADGVPVVFHDKKLRRMCGKNKKISNLKLEELKKLRLGKSNEHIPTFSEVLELIGGKVPVLIETKEPHRFIRSMKLEKILVSMLKEYQGEYLLQSFSSRSMKYMKKNLPGVKCGILSGKVHRECKGFDFINYRLLDLSIEKAEELKNRYEEVFAWNSGKNDLIKGEISIEEFGLDAVVV